MLLSIPPSLSDHLFLNSYTVKVFIILCPPPSSLPWSSLVTQLVKPACKVGDLGSIPEPEASKEKEMATLFSALAWKIPWTEEPGGLQSMGSQRDGHD